MGVPIRNNNCGAGSCGTSQQFICGIGSFVQTGTPTCSTITCSAGFHYGLTEYDCLCGQVNTCVKD